MNRDLTEYLSALGFEPAPYGTPVNPPTLPSSPPPAPAMATALPRTRVLFLVSGSSSAELSETQPAGQLLGRMIDAMGLKKTEICIHASDESTAPAVEAEMTVLMGASATGDSASAIRTHAPAELLKNPGLKKPTWEDLQKVMHRLGLKR